MFPSMSFLIDSWDSRRTCWSARSRPQVVAVAPESRSFIPECPLCHGNERYCAFLIGDERFDQCHGCGLLSHKAMGGVVATGTLEYGGGPDEKVGAALIDTFFSQLADYVGDGEKTIGVLG